MSDGVFDTLRALVGRFRGDVEALDVIARRRFRAGQGIQLAPGGPTLYGGAGAPSAQLGVPGDYYFRDDTPGTASQTLYVKTGPTTWAAAGGGSGLPSAPTQDSRLYSPSGGPAAWVAETNWDHAARLINATSAGAAANRSDHFDTNALDPKWTAEGDTSKTVVANSVLSCNPGSGSVYFWEDYTPSGIFSVKMLFRMAAFGGLLLTDGTATTTGNGVQVNYDSSAPGFQFWKLASGVFTQQGGNNNPPGAAGGWMWLRATRDGSNNWKAFFSYDDVDYEQYGTTLSSYSVSVQRLKLRSTYGFTTVFELVDVEL